MTNGALHMHVYGHDGIIGATAALRPSKDLLQAATFEKVDTHGPLSGKHLSTQCHRRQLRILQAATAVCKELHNTCKLEATLGWCACIEPAEQCKAEAMHQSSSSNYGLILVHVKSSMLCPLVNFNRSNLTCRNGVVSIPAAYIQLASSDCTAVGSSEPTDTVCRPMTQVAVRTAMTYYSCITSA